MNDYSTIKNVDDFESLIEYLEDELDWNFETEDIEDLTFEYDPEKELGLDEKTAAKISSIKQLRPLVANQTWGIFYIDFEPKKLPVVALRRILGKLVVKRRDSANKSDRAAWEMHDLLFMSSCGESNTRTMTFAHFSDNTGLGDLPILRTLSWDKRDTKLHLQHAHETLTDKLQFPENPEDADAWREKWASAFTLRHGEVIRTSKQLAKRLAELASNIRERANDILNIENEKGELRKLHKAFKEALISDLEYDDFADMYAQTISYGLLTAKISRTSGGLVADNIADMIPVTNPFLKELLQTFLVVGGRGNLIDFDELGINDVVEMLRDADMDAVLRDFGDKNPNEDPAIHFYELFLKEYDPEKRMKRGVFYTPRPVVSFIVRSVHEILRKEFGLEDGLADITTWGEMETVLSPAFRRNLEEEEPPEGGAQNFIPKGVDHNTPFVQILDPATGTGTFLVEVINVIHKTMVDKWNKQGKNDKEIFQHWNEYVPRHLLPRLYGFELMMAPYSIAHMKIGLKLSETGYSFLSSERAKIYLTNTLEEPKDFSGYLETMAPALAHEAEAANKVKKQTPITVVIGNPPYSGHSENNGDWIMQLLRGKDIMNGETTENYFEVDGKPLGERNPKWLNDDYVKFIRYAQRINEKAGMGVLSFISNNGYLENPTFRGMRQSLMPTYDKIYLLDLHGSAKKKEKHPDGSKDENVFDIEQGVGIGAFISLPNSETMQISHKDLFGVRETANDSNGKIGKYQWLAKNEIGTSEWTDFEPQLPFYLLIPQDAILADEFHKGWKATEMMPTNVLGFQTHRDHFAIDLNYDALKKRIKTFRESELSNEQIYQLYNIKDNRDWQLTNARNAVRINDDWEDDLITCAYRPFDNRESCFSTVAMDYPRRELIDHVARKENLCLGLGRQGIAVGEDIWALIYVSREPVDANMFRRGGINVFPLYLYPTQKDKLFGVTTRTPNFSDEFIKEFSEKLNLRFEYDNGETENPNIASGNPDIFTPEDVFHYAYAVFHSPTYRSRYAEFLKIDFPRLPLTHDRNLFRKLGKTGAELVALHLLEDVKTPEGWNLHTDGSMLIENHDVAAGYPKKELFDTDDEGRGKVYINKTAYFKNVSEEVWNFHIGGYQVCHKWLKDRKGRTLSSEDIAHYGKITVSLNETIRLMNSIDEIIEEHGGFPIAGSQDVIKEKGEKNG